MTELDHAVWRKSTRSNTNQNCVEVALLADGGVAVRDSKLLDASPILQFNRQEWDAFLSGVRRGEFDHPPAA